MEEIRPITMPGTHQRFLKFFRRKSEPTQSKVLDMGAGYGAFSKELFEMGYEVYACDLFPEMFRFDRVECKKADLTRELPYPDGSFDILIAIEVSEHIANHETFFSESARVLKPGGRLYISTPNILSLKSRLKFLLSGFFQSFDKLDHSNHDGLQHIASLTLDQYNYIAMKNGFGQADPEIDRKHNTAQWLLVILFPLIYIYMKLKKADGFHNQKRLLLGRLLFLSFNKI